MAHYRRITKLVEVEVEIDESDLRELAPRENDGDHLLDLAASEIRRGRLQEAAIYIARAIPQLSGLDDLASRQAFAGA